MTTEQQVLQVISGDGDFNEADVRQFVSAAHIDTAGVDYQTIAITGPQSSGKSTLMNALVSFVRHGMISDFLLWEASIRRCKAGPMG